jgi:hypothetical protein
MNFDMTFGRSTTPTQRRIILSDMNHDREIEGPCDLLRTAQGFEVVDARHIVRQACLDADDHVPIALDGCLRHRHAGRVEIVQLARRCDDAGARDIDEAAADLRRAPRNRRHRVDVVCAAGAGVDPAGHPVLKAHRRAFLAAAGVGVDVDQACSHEFTARIDGRGGFSCDAGFDCGDPAARNRDVTRRVEAHRWIDHPATLNDEIISCGKSVGHTGQKRRSHATHKLAPVHHDRYSSVVGLLERSLWLLPAFCRCRQSKGFKRGVQSSAIHGA